MEPAGEGIGRTTCRGSVRSGEVFSRERVGHGRARGHSQPAEQRRRRLRQGTSFAVRVVYCDRVPGCVGHSLLLKCIIIIIVKLISIAPCWMTQVVVTTGAIRRAKLQSKCRSQETNIQLFTGRMPFLSLNRQRQSTGGN